MSSTPANSSGQHDETSYGKLEKMLGTLRKSMENLRTAKGSFRKISGIFLEPPSKN